MTGVSMDSLTAANLPKLVVGDKIIAPWTLEQIAALEQWQATMHPYTCGHCRDRYGVDGDLVATVDGWVCLTCSDTQNWALAPRADCKYLVPILGGVAPICATCDGLGNLGVEDYPERPIEFCGHCKDGVPTSIVLTVECDHHKWVNNLCASCGLEHRMFTSRSVKDVCQRLVARASLLQVLRIDHDHRIPCPPEGKHVVDLADQLFLCSGERGYADISALLPLASWETSKWALLVKDLVIE